MPRKMTMPSPGVSILSENDLNPLPMPSKAILLSIRRFEDCASDRCASRMHDRERAALGLAGLDQEFSEEM